MPRGLALNLSWIGWIGAKALAMARPQPRMFFCREASLWARELLDNSPMRIYTQPKPT